MENKQTNKQQNKQTKTKIKTKTKTKQKQKHNTDVDSNVMVEINDLICLNLKTTFKFCLPETYLVKEDLKVVIRFKQINSKTKIFER